MYCTSPTKQHNGVHNMRLWTRCSECVCGVSVWVWRWEEERQRQPLRSDCCDTAPLFVHISQWTDTHTQTLWDMGIFLASGPHFTELCCYDDCSWGNCQSLPCPQLVVSSVCKFKEHQSAWPKEDSLAIFQWEIQEMWQHYMQELLACYIPITRWRSKYQMTISKTTATAGLWLVLRKMKIACAFHSPHFYNSESKIQYFRSTGCTYVHNKITCYYWPIHCSHASQQ